MTRLLAQADPSIGQIPQNHYVALDIVRLVGDDAARLLRRRGAARQMAGQTLHDPKRWKYHHLGVHALHGQFPPNHGGI